MCVCKGSEEQSSVSCCYQHLHAENHRFAENFKASMGCVKEKFKQELFFLSIWLPRDLQHCPCSLGQEKKKNIILIKGKIDKVIVCVTVYERLMIVLVNHSTTDVSLEANKCLLCSLTHSS